MTVGVSKSIGDWGKNNGKTQYIELESEEFFFLIPAVCATEVFKIATRYLISD